jgi:hypothetical protein
MSLCKIVLCFKPLARNESTIFNLSGKPMIYVLLLVPKDSQVVWTANNSRPVKRVKNEVRIPDFNALRHF